MKQGTMDRKTGGKALAVFTAGLLLAALIFTACNTDTPGSSTGTEETQWPADVTVIFDGGFASETITLSAASALSWAANTVLTVSVTENFASYQWLLDGAALAGETGKSVTLRARDMAPGSRTLTLRVVTDDSVPYNKTLAFTVN